MSDVKLYDLRERKYPHERGDVFRSLQVFECGVCGAETNRIVMGGWPGYGIRAVCQHAYDCWHHEIEDKMKLAAVPHPKSYMDELMAEISVLKAAHADKVTHDLEGEPDHAQRRWVTNTRGYSRGCTHAS